MMKKILAIISLFSLFLTACDIDTSNNKGEQIAGCPETKFSIIKSPANFDGSNIAFTDSYARYNKTIGTYRAMFTNYPVDQDSNSKAMEGDEKKLVITVFKTDGSEVTPGTYKMLDDNNLAVQLETAQGVHGITTSNDQDVGSVEITYVDDTKICGTIDVEDIVGLTVEGTFNAEVSAE